MTAKKTPATKTAETVQDEQFETFRSRALDLQGGTAAAKVADAPFVIAADDVFTEEISLGKPSFKTRMAIDLALTRGDTFRLLQLVFGEGLDDVLNDMDRYEAERQEDPIDLLNGIVYTWYEHFFGKGAASRVFRNASA